MYKFILNKAVSKLIIKFDFGAVLFIVEVNFNMKTSFKEKIYK